MKLRILLLTSACFLLIHADAQKFLNEPVLSDRPSSKKVTFWDIQRAFEDHWKDKPHSDTESENVEEGGWQQYKRWEWFAEQRTYPKGEFPSPEILFQQYQQYKTIVAQNKNIGNASVNNWSFIGPGVVPGNGGGAGRINCITFDPNNSSILWVGAACGGVWRSTDGGVTWTSNTDLLPSLSVSEIVIDPNNTQVMYLATGDKYGIYSQYETWGHYSAGVLKSTDGGVTWNATGMSYVLSNVTIIERLIMDPTSTNTLYAATNMGIFKTTDGGTTWNNIQSGSFYDIEMNPSTPSTLYAGNGSNLLRSTNSGSTWSTVPGVTSTGRTSIAVSAASASTVYCWTEGGSFYYSNNSGVSFTVRTDPSSMCTPYGYYDMVMDVSPVNANIITAGGLDIARSLDGGQTWMTISNWNGWPSPTYVHADNHAHKFAPGSSQVIYSCNDGGIFKSTDQGATWSDLSNGIHIKQYYRLSCSALSSNLIYAGAQDNGTDKITGMNSATQVYGADGEECLVDYTNDNTVFVSYQGGNFSKSTDGGATFNGISAGGCDWTSPIIMDPSNNNIMYSGGADIYKSTDNGTTWNALNGTFDGNCMYSLEICNSSPANLYAATFGNIYRSSNGGATWSNITGTLPVNSAAISGIAVKGNDPLSAWVTFSGFSAGNKVFYTNNGGATWVNVSGTLPNVPANCIEYQNGSNDLLYLGTDLGVFYIDASMNNWSAYNTGLPNVIIDELEISYSVSKLRAATYGRGLWECDLQVSTLQALDASASTMVYPPTTLCDSVIAPIVRIKNAGVNTITTVELHYRIDNQAWQIYNYNGSLASQATYDVALPTYTLSSGLHTLKAYTANPNSGTDMNLLNDTIVRPFTVLGNPVGSPPPVVQGFVSTAFPPTGWTLENSSNIWSRSNLVGGFGTSSECAVTDFYNVLNGNDKIISSYIDFSTAVAPIRLYFDVAYAPYSTVYFDSLAVDMYTDCPGNGVRIYSKGNTQLATASATTGIFVPTSTQWRTDSINLDSLAGRPAREFRFMGISGYGNQLYLDNINLSVGIGSGINNLHDELGLLLFPNPANNTLNVEIASTSNDKISVELYDITGSLVMKREEAATKGKTRMIFDVSLLSQGIYLVKVQQGLLVKTQKLTIGR